MGWGIERLFWDGKRPLQITPNKSSGHPGAHFAAGYFIVGAYSLSGLNVTIPGASEERAAVFCSGMYTYILYVCFCVYMYPIPICFHLWLSILGIAGHRFSVTTNLLCYWSVKAAIKMHKQISMTLFQKEVMCQIWP